MRGCGICGEWYITHNEVYTHMIELLVMRTTWWSRVVPRTILGWAGDRPGNVPRLPQDGPWTVWGRFRNDLETVPGPSRDYPGAFQGLFLGVPRTIPGRPRDHPETIPGSCWDDPGAVQGLHRDDPRTVR